ncbi:MAG TPA: cytochrome c [Vicinamibacterales bacterium]|nr:cytochrome c [Vicinamibacterales bacterium]
MHLGSAPLRSASAPPHRRTHAPLLLLTLTLTTLAAAQSGRTVWDGVYTEAQASRGEALYRKVCAHCHQPDLLGEGPAVALVGQAFATRWNGQTVDDLFQTIKRSMPQEAPDSLGPQGYADIVSYILQANGMPGGPAELPVETPALQQIQIVARTPSP